jgi:hypothetical protein
MAVDDRVRRRLRALERSLGDRRLLTGDRIN